MHRRCQLYLITPPRFELPAFTRLVEEALADGHVAAFQLRMKDAGDADILAAGKALKPIVQNAACAFIVNDRPDLAAKLDADGVHIGQGDASYSKARSLIGADKIVGVTCHNSRDLAYEAAEAGAAEVLGVDLSERMLARALGVRAGGDDPRRPVPCRRRRNAGSRAAGRRDEQAAGGYHRRR
jgi:thiamine monophosphate synthase